MIPTVKFDTNLELDAQMTYSFLHWSMDGIDFSEDIFGPNPGLRQVDTNDIKQIYQYLKGVYAEKKADLQTVIDWNKLHWEKIEAEFMHKIITLFKGHEFPDGKYIGYLSVNNCNPRFLEDKTFQMYYKAKVYNRTISHELTHFIFYDYTAHKHANIFARLDPNAGNYWSLAELFNNVILSQPEYVQLLENFGDGAYPNHVEHFAPLQKIWEQNQDVDAFIVNAFNYLEQHN